MPVEEPTAVQGADVAAHRHHLLPVLRHQPHGVDQGLAIDEDVGVGGHHVGIAGDVDGGVEGVGPAAILLVDHGQRDREGRLVDLADRRRRDRGPHGERHRDHPELLDEAAEGVVAAAVVGDHDLEARVGDHGHGADCLHDARRLVVGGDHDRDGGSEVGGQHVLRPAELRLQPVPVQADGRDPGQQEQRRLDRQEVHQGQDRDGREQGGHAGAARAASRRSGSVAIPAPTRSMARARVPEMVSWLRAASAA